MKIFALSKNMYNVFVISEYTSVYLKLTLHNYPQSYRCTNSYWLFNYNIYWTIESL